MIENTDIFNLAHRSLKLAEQDSPDLRCAEFFLENHNYINIEIEENSIKNSEIGSDSGASIRVINRGGSLGFAFTNNLENSSIDKMTTIALKMMSVGTEDKDFKDLPRYYKNYPNVKNLYDKAVKNLNLEDTLSHVKDIIKVCNDDELAISQSANFQSSYSSTYIFNSNGIEVSSQGTFCSISSNIIVKDKTTKETSFGYEWQSERNLKDLKPVEIAKKALEDAKRNLNRKKIKDMKIPLILTPKGTIKLILKPLVSAINAETFQYQRSFLINKRGETIGSESLNIEDNALIDGAIGSRSFDDEGVPCKNKMIFERGKFLTSGLLHNSYTAGKEGIESTGNASRYSYISIPSINCTNFIMKPGVMSKDEIIEDIKMGVILDYTGDSPNISTGDFSGLILHGNLIKNGEIKDPLNETMIGINLMELFKNIDAVSNEYKAYDSFQAPYVKIKEIKVIGGVN